MFIEESKLNWESLYCPNQHCRFYGISFYEGLVVKNGSSHGQKQALCKACGSSVSLRYGTAYLWLEADPAIFETAVRALAEGNSLRATARIVQIDKDTACDWLDRAAQHCRLIMLYLWRNLHVTECQLDELWSFFLPTPEPTRGTGTARCWRPMTPAMAAGLTDHVWTTTELLSYRVPGQFIERLSEIERPFPPPAQTHQGS